MCVIISVLCTRERNFPHVCEIAFMFQHIGVHIYLSLSSPKHRLFCQLLCLIYNSPIIRECLVSSLGFAGLQ